MKRLLGMTLAATALAVLSGARADGQTCNVGLGDCSPPQYAHTASGGGSYGGDPHPQCKVCLVWGDPAPAGICHECPQENLSVDQRVAYSAVRLASAKGDVTQVLRLAAKTGGLVVYNQHRRAIQLVSCSGRDVIASLPIRSAAHVALAVNLPRTPTAQAPATEMLEQAR